MRGVVLLNGKTPAYGECVACANARHADMKRLITERAAVLTGMAGDPAQDSLLRDLDRDIDIAESDMDVYIALARRAARTGR